MHWLDVAFGLTPGHELQNLWVALYPNLLASVICTAIVWVKMHKHHKRVEEKLHQIHEHVKADRIEQ